MATSGNESPIPIPVDESRDNWNDEDEIVSSTIYVKVSYHIDQAPCL